MKKTLTEEKKRIFEIMSQVDKSFIPSEKGEKEVEEQVDEGNAFGQAVAKAKEEGKDTFELGGETHNVQEAELSELGPKASTGPSEEELKEQVQFFTMMKIKQEGLTSDEIKQIIGSWIDEEESEGNTQLENSTETDEYQNNYSKNMTQGFKLSESMLNPREFNVEAAFGDEMGYPDIEEYKKYVEWLNPEESKFETSEDHESSRIVWVLEIPKEEYNNEMMDFFKSHFHEGSSHGVEGNPGGIVEHVHISPPKDNGDFVRVVIEKSYILDV